MLRCPEFVLKTEITSKPIFGEIASCSATDSAY